MKNSIFNFAGVAQGQSNCLVHSRSLGQFQLSALTKQIKMVNKILKFRYLFKLFVFIPLIFYFGKRSYIAFDEGLESLDELKKISISKGNSP